MRRISALSGISAVSLPTVAACAYEKSVHQPWSLAPYFHSKEPVARSQKLPFKTCENETAIVSEELTETAAEIRGKILW